MGRRVTNGIVGTSGSGGLGNLTVENVTVSSAVLNEDILFDPSGTGRVLFDADTQLQAQADLRFADADSSNFVAIQAPAVIATNYTLTLPAAVAGTTGFVLTSDTAGALTWAAAAVPLSDNTTDSSTNYLLFNTTTSGSLTSARVSSTKMTFQPSTGTLTSTLLRANGGTASTNTTSGALVVTGGVGISGQMTATSIVETSSMALKQNITPIVNALESVLKLNGVTYDRVDNNEHEAGLIAEWTAKVLPDLVTIDADGNAVGIKYTKLTAYLIESIRTLKQEINELKGRR